MRLSRLDESAFWLDESTDNEDDMPKAVIVELNTVILWLCSLAEAESDEEANEADLLTDSSDEILEMILLGKAEE